MKMIFKCPYTCSASRCTAAALVVALLLPLRIYADATVINPEKNDKISRNSLSLQVINDGKTVNAGETGTLDTNRARTWELHAEQWELARSGESVLSLPVLKQLLNTWLQDKNRKIEVRYPGGEEGEFWVQELTDWLVSLGIPSRHIMVIPGSGADDMIKFALIKQ